MVPGRLPDESPGAAGDGFAKMPLRASIFAHCEINYRAVLAYLTISFSKQKIPIL